MSLKRDVFAVQRGGMHDVVQTPEFQAALDQAVSNYIGANAPGLLELLRRFLTPGDHNASRSFAVGTAAGGPNVSGDSGRVQVLNRDPTRVQALVQNRGTSSVFLGDRQVSVGSLNDGSGGIELLPQAILVFSDNRGELYAVSSVAGQDVRVLDNSGGVG